MVGYWTSFARTGHPQAAGQPVWLPYDSTAAYMDLTDAPHPADHLLSGMFALHEQAVCRRRVSGNLPWNWNVGLASPPLPDPKALCRE